MTDHITDALVEQAARAGFGLDCVDEAHANALWNTCHESAEQYLRETRAALSAVVPKIVQAAKVEALRDAAATYQTGGWADLPQAEACLGCKRRQAEHAVRWLRDRAGEIERGES